MFELESVFDLLSKAGLLPVRTAYVARASALLCCAKKNGY